MTKEDYYKEDNKPWRDSSARILHSRIWKFIFLKLSIVQSIPEYFQHIANIKVVFPGYIILTGDFMHIFHQLWLDSIDDGNDNINIHICRDSRPRFVGLDSE